MWAEGFTSRPPLCFACLMTPASAYLTDVRVQFEKMKKLAEGALAQVTDDELLATLERLFERVVPGGQIVISDLERSPAQHRARRELDLWLASRGYRALSLPTGQGLLTRR